MTDFELMGLALEEAAKAAALGEVPVGAVVARHGEVVATAHNTRETEKNALHHAELLAIDAACKALGGWRLWECELFVTLEPCPMCAGGIINIINRAEDILGRAPDYVFAGFHLYNPSLGQSEPRALVDAVGERLCARKATRYVTGHCTGDDAYAWLHETLGDRLAYMATGTTFTI